MVKKIKSYINIMDISSILNIDLFLVLFMIGIVSVYIMSESPRLVKKI